MPVRGMGAGMRMTREDLEAVAEQVERMEQVEWVQEIPELEESGDDLQQVPAHAITQEDASDAARMNGGTSTTDRYSFKFRAGKEYDTY